MFVGTQIWSGVSWFKWQLVEAVWRGFRETGINVGHAKTGILEEGLGLLPGAYGAPF